MARKTASKPSILSCEILLQKPSGRFDQRERRLLAARTKFAVELHNAPPAHVYIVDVNEDKDSVRLLYSSDASESGASLRLPSGTAWLTLPEKSYVVAVGSAVVLDEKALADYLDGRAPDRQMTGGRTTRA